MSKYDRREPLKKKSGPHFIWRGLGCLMMIIIPVMSVAIGYELVNFLLANKYYVPRDLLGTPQFPDIFYKSSGMMIILKPIIAIKHFYAYALFSIILMVVLGSVISLIYSYIYRVVGPARYGPLDAPPPKVKVKQYKR
ncbi:MAG: hypothetical protein LC099_05305 [Anaerolineales bacterium]|nr:hypothetical protein [Anaerolineales bacterium]